MSDNRKEITNKHKRDENGLLINIDYVFDENNQVNWKAMIPKEFIVVNKERFEKRGETVPETTEGVDEKDLLITLPGIKAVARLRGFLSKRDTPIAVSDTFVSMRTTIRWVPNYETNGESVEFDDCADAHQSNTSGFGRFYLTAIASNRSFVRAVRNFLNINIVGQDEVSDETEPESTSDGKSNGDPYKYLSGILKKNKVKWENFKNRMVKVGIEGAAEWENLKDIPASEVFNISAKVLEEIEKAKQEAAKAKEG